METLTDLEALEKQREEAERETKRKREQEISDFRSVMEMPAGRRFVWRLMREGGVFHTSFTGEALSSAHQEGQRKQGLRLLNEILEVCPERWLEMIKEQAKR